MELTEIEKAVKSPLHKMPDNLAMYEQLYFLSYLEIYTLFKKGIIPVDIAQEFKRKVTKQYEKQKAHDDLIQNLKHLMVKTCEARATYIGNRTLENADAIVTAIDGTNHFKRGDMNQS